MKKFYFLLFVFSPFIAFATVPCPPDMTVYADGPDCTATVILPDVPWGGTCGIYYNCSVTISGQQVEWDGSNWVAYNLPAGNYTVEYASVANCHYPYYCTMNLRVLGGGNVSAVCDANTVVSLGQNGVGRVYAETFNDHSNSSCGEITHIEVRRVHQGWCPPGVKDDTSFGPYVEFCCADIGNNPIKVILRVTDSQGNTNECSAYVYVQDKIPPRIYCLPDITVDCDYPIDLNDLSEFGTIRHQQSHCQPIYVGGHHCGYDGYVTDNCDVAVTETHFSEINECGTGWIKRIFTATDDYGNSTHCIQFIYIKSSYPFNAHHINWPQNMTVYDCSPEDLSPAITGEPTFSNVACTMVASTYSDLEFIFNDNEACMKILREWKVIDWCNYNSHTGRGLYTHLQTIKITDGEAPVFLDCDDINVCPTDVDGCKGYVELYPQVEDCTPQDKITWKVWIDYDNNGNVDQILDYGDISGYFPYGTHKITWEANDGCGNRSTCTKLVTIRDCNKPTPVCYSSIATVVMENSGLVQLNARVHDAGSWDNCTTSNNLRFSFTPNPADSLKTFTCDDLGINEIPIYVTDAAGNQSKCNVRLDIQDNKGACLDSLTVHMQGIVATEAGNGISDVHFSVLHPDLGEFIISSNEQGEYAYASYTNLSGFDSVMVMPLRTDHPLNGVTSYDLFVMHKINLGDFQFESPYQLIAADVNNDGRFSTFDLVELKKLILGQYQDFQDNLSWRFVDGMEAVDEDNPLDFNDMQMLTLPELNSRFVGVKIGDMNLDANPAGEAQIRSSGVVEFLIEDQYVKAGESIEFDIQIPEVQTEAFQLFIKNERLYSVETLTINGDPDNTYMNEEYAGMVYFKGADKAGSTIQVRIKPAINGYLSNMIQLSELRPSLLAEGNNEEKEIILRFNNYLEADELQVNVIPNPITVSTEIHITSPENQEANLSMYNVNGTQVLQKNIRLNDGQNVVKLDSDLIDLSAGVYYISISTDKNTVRKTVVKM